MRTITYYAIARTPVGKIGQLFVTREPGHPMRQEWTGVVYKTMTEANRDLERLNCAALAARDAATADG